MQNQGPVVDTLPDLDAHWDVVTWSRDYETGHTGIDSDHQRLLVLFNEFSQAVNSGKGPVVIREVLDELTDYTHYHFAREELIMQECDFPDYGRHKRMHETFIRQVEDVSKHYMNGGDLSAFLLSFLAKWLSGHILSADRQLGRYLGENAAEH